MKYRISFFLLFFITCSVSAQIVDSATRLVKLEGAVNFRDIGGYQTTNGKHVKSGLIYRSAALNGLTENDLEKLKELNLRTIFDFRSAYEVSSAPDKVIAGTKRVSLPFGSEHIGTPDYQKHLAEYLSSDSFILNFYRNLEPFKARYQPVFDSLLYSKEGSILYHCTGGKDRAGIATALILYAMGVDEKTIFEDYEATNYYRKAANEKTIQSMVKSMGIQEDKAQRLMRADPHYLQLTFDEIKKQYGSIDRYLNKVFGLTNKKIKLLRAKYTA